MHMVYLIEIRFLFLFKSDIYIETNFNLKRTSRDFITGKEGSLFPGPGAMKELVSLSNLQSD